MTTPHQPEPKRSFPWRAVIVGGVVLVGLAVLSSRLDVDQLHAQTEKLDGWLVFGLLVVLPLFGFPVSVLHVLAGIRWGTKLGLELVVLSILLQLLASHGLVRLFHPLFEKRFSGLRERLPRGAHGPVCLFTMLVPGVPYFAKNYVLPLMGVPLHTFLLWCFPLHALRSSVAVLFGDASDELTVERVVGFGLYAVAITVSCAWAFRRLRQSGAFASSGSAAG